MQLPSSFLRRRTGLHSDQQGVAAVEFALILPVLVTLFFGALETSNMLIADSRLRNAVGSIADLITQKGNGEVSLSDMQVANVAGKAILDPLRVSGPRLAFLLVMHRPIDTSTSEVAWARIIHADSTTPTTSDTLGLSVPQCSDSTLPLALLPKDDEAPKNDVLQVTGIYEWHPWFTVIFGSSIQLRSTNYNMPRYSLQLSAAADVSPACKS